MHTRRKWETKWAVNIYPTRNFEYAIGLMSIDSHTFRYVTKRTDVYLNSISPVCGTITWIVCDKNIPYHKETEIQTSGPLLAINHFRITSFLKFKLNDRFGTTSMSSVSFLFLWVCFVLYGTLFYCETKKSSSFTFAENSTATKSCFRSLRIIKTKQCNRWHW